MSHAPFPPPSTDWQEHPAADEAERFARYAEQFAELQQRKSARYGQGRALHRKQLLAARGELTVHGNLPDFARHGLFARPGRYDTWVRLSNGGMDRVSDRRPDVRGFALAVQGVQGPSALGAGPTAVQCFALINQRRFAFATSGEFVDFVVAASQGHGALLGHLVRRYGWLGGPARLLSLVKTLGQPFAGFAHETFFSAAPLACGPYAVRVRLTPAGDPGPADPAASQDWGADMLGRLARGPLTYTLALQPYVNERITPIEDASVDWPTPYTDVATLTLPTRTTGQDPAWTSEVENAVFDPWAALADHRPLGDVMRARKVVYFASQQGRQAG